jgi:hypothetical protein
MGNEFSGLPIADLIGGPLTAACDAQVRLAKATADFITSVGFNPEIGADGKPTNKLVPRQVDFSFWQPVARPHEAEGAEQEVLATGSITLGGTPGTTAAVKSIKVGDVEVLGASIPSTGTLEKTASDAADQINKSGSIPRYTASAKGATITITASAGTGASPNGFAIVPTCDVITCTSSRMSGGKDAGVAEAKVQKVVLSVPFLAIVNVPSLMVKTVDTVFDMEVKSSESYHEAEDKAASLDATAKVGWGPFSAEVKIHGAISAHKESTRSTDRSAKYHVEVHASDDGMSEGLCRVLDILQKAIAPVSVSQPTALANAKIAQTVA